MLSQNPEPLISSELKPEIMSNREKNIKFINNYLIKNTISPKINNINNNINNINKIIEPNQIKISKNNKNNYFRRIDSPVLLKSKKNNEPNDLERIKLEINQPKKVKIKKIINNNLQENLNINKIIEQYLYQIQRLQNSIKNKEDEINSLKIQLENNEQKGINRKCFDILDVGGMGLKILAEEKQNNKNTSNVKRIYKIQSLDKMEILNENINYDINIETRDSIEILPTLKAPLKGQKTIQLQIDPLKKRNYIQILDQLVILSNKKKEIDIEIEERDSIEILPTQKTPLQAQKTSQMYIQRLEIPKFLIQNIDNMSIFEENKKYNTIESRDVIQIVSLEMTPLKAQHVQNMVINKLELDNNVKKIKEDKEILSTPRNKNYIKLINSIEHIPIKKSPLQLKNVEDLRNKYIKKNKSENKMQNNINKEKNELKIDYIESINICNITSKPKSNSQYYSYSNALIKPTLKMQNIKNNKNNKNIKNNNQKIEEISLTNKKYKFNLVSPKPSILPLSKTTKNINVEKYEKKRIKTKIKYINDNNKDKNNNSSSIYKKSKILNKVNEIECENKKGRNVRVIRTQKHGPSIVEKRFIAHSCEKCNNNLNFQKIENISIRNNFHVIHSMKNNDNHDNY